MEKESKEKLIEEVKNYSEDEEIYDMYKYHSKQELIHNTLIDEARIDGMNEGISQGISQGHQEKSIEIAKKMLDKKISIEDISELTGLTSKQIQYLKSNE